MQFYLGLTLYPAWSVCWLLPFDVFFWKGVILRVNITPFLNINHLLLLFSVFFKKGVTKLPFSHAKMIVFFLNERLFQKGVILMIIFPPFFRLSPNGSNAHLKAFFNCLFSLSYSFLRILFMIYYSSGHHSELRRDILRLASKLFHIFWFFKKSFYFITI